MSRRFVLQLTLTFALCLMLPLLAHADYVYSFSGETTGGTVDTFTFTSTTLIQSDTVVSLSSCASGGVPCSYAAIYPNGASYIDPSNPVIYYDQMITGANPGDYYFFDSDAFGQVGVHTTDAFFTSLLEEYATDITIGTGTLTVTNTAAVPEPSSLALLGTGVLGFLGPIRRKLLASWER